MEWLINLSVRWKLTILTSVLLFILLIVIFTSLDGIRGFSNSQQQLFEVEYPLTLNLSKLSSDLSRERFALRRFVASRNINEKISWHQEMMDVKSEIDEKIEVIDGLSVNLEKIPIIIAEFKEVRDSFYLLRDQKIISASYRVGITDEEIELLLGSHSVFGEKLRSLASNASRISEEHDSIIMKESEEAAGRLTTTFIVAGVLALLISILFSLYLVRITSDPLIQLSDLAEKVAYGDLNVNIPPQNRKDEIGNLWLSFNMMVGTLRIVTKDTNQLIRDLLDSLDSLQADQSPQNVEAFMNEIQLKSEKLKKVISEYKV